MLMLLWLDRGPPVDVLLPFGGQQGVLQPTHGDGDAVLHGAPSYTVIYPILYHSSKKKEMKKV